MLEYFFEITKIPRPSYKEGKIADYICDFAEKRGLSYYRDDLIAQSERQLKEGICDIIGYGRVSLAYPMLYRDSLKGEFSAKKCCLACSKCTLLMRAGQVSGCAVFNEYYRDLYGRTCMNK